MDPDAIVSAPVFHQFDSLYFFNGGSWNRMARNIYFAVEKRPYTFIETPGSVIHL